MIASKPPERAPCAKCVKARQLARSWLHYADGFECDQKTEDVMVRLAERLLAVLDGD
jgi:hypothetical protein